MIAALPASGAETLAAPRKAPWGFWASLLWGATGYALIVTTFLAVGFVRVTVAARGGGDIDALTRTVFESGFTITLAYLVCMPIALAMILSAIGVRRGPTVVDYLGLRRISLVKLSPWILSVVAIEFLVVPIVSRTFGVPMVPEFIQGAYPTAGWTPALWIAIAGAAPIIEEALYRGLVLRGWAVSRLGPAGSVVLIAVLWAATHVQYGLIEQAMVFSYGLLLGAARLSTHTLITPIVMHMAVNAMVLMRAAALA